MNKLTRRPGFTTILLSMLGVGFLLRVAYVVAQPGGDPHFSRPILDGAYYWNWALQLAAGSNPVDGAYYLAPLYPLVLRPFIAIFGESFTLLYLLQHAAVVVTAGLIALVGRRVIGEGSGLAAAALVLLYQPLLFFASRPVGEALGVLLLALGLYLYTRHAASPAGAALGLAALARPNLLLVPAAWVLREARRKHWARTVLLVVGVSLMLAPSLIRNWRASGHVVPVSSNAGITLYYGNGPNARGVGALPEGFSGDLTAQRQEATRQARLWSGRDLDPVQADRFWGRQALSTRIDDPWGTALLLVRRASLSVSNTELGLDYAPSLDPNPWRFTAPIPFTLLLALAAAGVYLRGFERTGGWPVWGAILAAAVAPIIFYVSSRYRLPAAALLSLPAGAGAVALTQALRERSRGYVPALVFFVSVVLVSVGVPTGRLSAILEANALAQRGGAWSDAGNHEAAEADLERALALDDLSPAVHVSIGRHQERTGRDSPAVASYRMALALDPSRVDAAANLADLLNRHDLPQQALPVLVDALRLRPDHEACRINLIVTLSMLQRYDEAWRAVEQARRLGVAVDPDLAQTIDRLRRE